MSILQHYFSYKIVFFCGIPSVTLQGEKAGWLKILTRIDKLPSFGKEVAEWHKLLVPVLSRFVAAFDDPASEHNKDFWQKMMKSVAGFGSGGSHISGWISAFCFWDEEGRKLDRDGCELSLDGVRYHSISVDDVPFAWATAPVKVNDDGYDFMARMIAGSVGVRASGSGEPAADGSVGKDTLQPEVGWSMMKVKLEN